MAAAVAAAAPPRAPADRLAPPARPPRLGGALLPATVTRLHAPPLQRPAHARPQRALEGVAKVIAASHWLNAVPVRKGVPREEEDEARPIAAMKGGAWRAARGLRVGERVARGGPGLAARLPEGEFPGPAGLRLFPRRARGNQALSGSGVSPLRPAGARGLFSIAHKLYIFKHFSFKWLKKNQKEESCGT